MRRQSWRIPCSLPLLPSLPRFLCMLVQERPHTTTRRANSHFPSSSSASKKLVSFPYNGHPVNDFEETTQREEVACQKVNTFLSTLLVVHQLVDISQCYETWPNITMDSFVLDIVKHGIKLDFCSQAICSNYTSRCSLTAEAVDAEIKLLLLKHVLPHQIEGRSFCLYHLHHHEA